MYTSSHTIYTPNDIYSDILYTYGVYLKYSKTWRNLMSRHWKWLGVIQHIHSVRYQNSSTCCDKGILVWSHKWRLIVTISSNIVLWHLVYQYEDGSIVVDGTYLNGHYGEPFSQHVHRMQNSIFILAFKIRDNKDDKSWR